MPGLLRHPETAGFAGFRHLPEWRRRRFRTFYEFVEPRPAARQDIAAVHTPLYIEPVVRQGLYDIAALAAGGAIMAAEIGLSEPCFGRIRPPGHHASAASGWGFCFFNSQNRRRLFCDPGRGVRSRRVGAECQGPDGGNVGMTGRPPQTGARF